MPDDRPAACHSCEPPNSNGRALSVCTTSGCSCLVASGKCHGCRRTNDSQRRKRNRAHYAAYGRKDWQRTRAAFLREHPYCECDECLQLPAILRPAATVVDHIDGLGPLGPRGHDWSNLRAMTKAHHDRRTMRDQVNGLDAA